MKTSRRPLHAADLRAEAVPFPYKQQGLQLVRGLASLQNIACDSGIILKEVLKQIKGLEVSSWTGAKLSLGDWNMEFLNLDKVTKFLPVYREIVTRHHLLATEEVDASGLAALANACGYGRHISACNSRGQAVGFLLHPRLQVLGSFEYAEMTRVFGIPDLRPALRLVVWDSATGLEFNVVVVHLKSMRGGVKATSVVRREQLRKLVRELSIADQFTMILGDFNCFLDETDDTRPLTTDGYVLLNPWNQAPTHQFGGRLDGLFHKNLPQCVRLSNYSIYNFWRNPWIGNTLSDHGLLSWKLSVDATPML